MKILVSSDWHLDAVTAGVRRIHEHDDYHRAIVDCVIAEGIELVLLLGDYFDPGTMAAHRCSERLMWAVGELAQMGILVVVLAGNHDVVEGGDSTVLSPMLAASVRGFGGDNVVVVEEPTAFEARGVVVLALPYVARANRGLYAPDRMAELYSHARELGRGLPVIVIAHLTVTGAQMGSESEEFARGSELLLPVDDIAKLSPALVLNGHYHRPQTVHAGRVDVVIPGSPQRLTFAEEGDYEKGFLVVEL